MDGVEILKETALQESRIFKRVLGESARRTKAGKAFGKGVKEEAFAEDPTKTCVFCQRPGTGSQVDHAYPKSLGGDAEIGNAQLACRHCNPSKGNGIVPKSPPPGYKGQWPTPRLKAFEKLVKKSRGWK
ncbi:HNH endonuclease [Rhizobium leguminosarum]|uniref:HNH endonuclease n=1 Tax=Rhizobium leguminosarum TaxID=384 RepID=UPI002E116758|nr:HNH endonuclease [Rhizobium leguminosarum]